jgi:glycosyltransferase involved in cell wall biosynthesis
MVCNRTISGWYNGFINIVSNLNIKEYDLVYMDFTKSNFVAKWAKNNKLPLIVRAHNVEADYTKSLYDNNHNFDNWLKKVTAKMSESDCVKMASKVIAITSYEKKRFMELYQLETEKISIIPVCVKKFNGKKFINKKPYILITGSLWFGPNVDGTIWFCKNVWKKIQDTIGLEYDLVIAGSTPPKINGTKTIRDDISDLRNVYLYENPEDIGPYYMGASIYIAPIFYGAGMKVKVAEALSCGLPVIATRHALTGYEAADKYTYKADNVEEFINAIHKAINIPDKLTNKDDIYKIYEDNYSIEKSALMLKDIIYSIND